MSSLNSKAPAKPMLATQANGVRVLALPLPNALTVNLSVFVRSGSAHEPRRLSGISHVIEHTLFKGSHTRDARRINLDAERLGTEVNAHTDKDHSAFHMRCHPRDISASVRMLADIVLCPSFPAHELDNERQVLLQEFAEDEDDPMASAWKLFDKACWGTHGAAQPVIGSRRLIESFSRDDLEAYHREHFTGANLVLAAAGPIDADKLVREVERGFASLARGQAQVMLTPNYGGGIRARAQVGSSQAHAVLGFGINGLQAKDATAEVAAAVIGEGMSSPLMQRLREERGLVYYAACAADVMDGFGQFVVEASMARENLQDTVAAAAGLLSEHAHAVDKSDLARAHKQLALRQLQLLERPQRWLEQAALDVFVHGRPRSQARAASAAAAIGVAQVRHFMASLLQQPATLAMTGHLARDAKARALSALAQAGLRAKPAAAQPSPAGFG